MFKSILAKGLLIALLFFVLLGVWSLFIEPNRLVLHNETINLRNWPAPLDGLRIADVSDIHAGSPFMDVKKMQDIVARTNQTNPDLVVLLGDFMVQNTWHSKTIAPEIIADQLKELRAPLGVYAVLGNHDWWFNGQRVRAELERVGIKVLDNEATRLEFKGQPFWLAGIRDAWTNQDDIAGTLKQMTPGEPAIALTHNPDLFPKLSHDFQLTLAAHTHGGQVNLPLVGRLIVPSEYGQRYAAGHIQEDGRDLFVTTGIGTSVFPIRFRVTPEIAVVTLRSVR